MIVWVRRCVKDLTYKGLCQESIPSMLMEHLITFQARFFPLFRLDNCSSDIGSTSMLNQVNRLVYFYTSSQFEITLIWRASSIQRHDHSMYVHYTTLHYIYWRNLKTSFFMHMHSSKGCLTWCYGEVVRKRTT